VTRIAEIETKGSLPGIDGAAGTGPASVRELSQEQEKSEFSAGEPLRRKIAS
jgi:hypothetical protein